jgi:hypothetical protein
VACHGTWKNIDSGWAVVNSTAARAGHCRFTPVGLFDTVSKAITAAEKCLARDFTRSTRSGTSDAF